MLINAKTIVVPSKLCYADKMSLCLEPGWLYLLRVNLSGEIKEYMRLAREGKYKGNGDYPEGLTAKNIQHQIAWLKEVKTFMRNYVEDNK